MTEHNHKVPRTACGPACPANPWHRDNWQPPSRPTKAELAQAVELSAQALREMLAEESAVDAAVRGAYAPVVDKLAGNMYNHGKQLVEQQEPIEFRTGQRWQDWQSGALWMLEKMVGYVTGERL